MGLLLPLASLLGIEVGDLIERIRKYAIAWAIIALFGLIGLVYLLVALHAALLYEFGPVWAPLVIAAAALLIALGVYATIRIAAARSKKRELQRRHATDRTTLMTTAAMAAAPMLLKSSLVRTVGIPVGGALAAFYLLWRARRNRDSDPTP